MNERVPDHPKTPGETDDEECLIHTPSCVRGPGGQWMRPSEVPWRLHLCDVYCPWCHSRTDITVGVSPWTDWRAVLSGRIVTCLCGKKYYARPALPLPDLKVLDVSPKE